MKLRRALHVILVIWGKGPILPALPNRGLLPHVHTYSRCSMARASIPASKEQPRLLGIV